MITMRHLNALASAALVVAADALSTQAAAAGGVTYYARTDSLPFAEAVRIDRRLILNGQVAVTDDGASVIPGGWEAETRRVMTLIGGTLKKHGLGYDDITDCTVMLVDIDRWADFNGVYGSFFKPGHYPARRTFGVTGLPRGARVEIACQAQFPS